MKLKIWLFIFKNFFKNKKLTKKKGGIFIFPIINYLRMVVIDGREPVSISNCYSRFG